MKKLVCLLLAVIMAVSVCSIVAAAEEKKLDPSSIVIDGIRDEAYKESQKIGTEFWYAFSTNTTVWDAYDPNRFISNLYFTFDDDFVYLYFTRKSYDTIHKPEEGETFDDWKNNIIKADWIELISVYLDTVPSAPVNQATANNGDPSSDFDRNCISGADPYHRLQARVCPQFGNWYNYFRTDEGMFLDYDKFYATRCDPAASGYGANYAADPEGMYLKENGDCAAASFVDYETNTIGFELKYHRVAGESSFRVGVSTSAKEFDWDEWDPELGWDTEIAYTIANGPAWWRNFDALITRNYEDYDPTTPDPEVVDPSADVIALIDKLPAVESLTLSDKTAVTAARAAYNALGNDAKEKVTNLEKLVAAEAKIASLETTYGDLNGDKRVDASDALVALKAAVKKVTLTDAQTKAADVNGDTKVDASDALLMLKKAVGKITKFPVEEN